MARDAPPSLSAQKEKSSYLLGGKKGSYRFTCVLDTLRDGKLTQEWRGEGRRRRRRDGGLDLGVSGVISHLFCILASFKVLTVTRSLLFFTSDFIFSSLVQISITIRP